MTEFDYGKAWKNWQEMSIEDYETAVFAATLDAISSWVIGQPNAYGRMVAEPPRLEGSHPDTQIVVIMWDDNVGTYERRYKIWRDDSRSAPSAVPPPGIRSAPESLALGIAEDLPS